MKYTACAVLAIILATGILQAQAAKKPKPKFCRGKNGIKYKQNEGYEEGCTQFMCVKKGKKIKMMSKPVPKCVDGDWSLWSSWSDCTSTCGTATKTRERTCSNPTPTNGGNPCPGLKEQIDECSLPSCGSSTPSSSTGTEENMNVTALEMNVESLAATVETLQDTVHALLSLVTKQETCLGDINSAKCPSSKGGKTSLSDAIMKNKDNIQFHHTGPKFQLKGETGEEKVTISMDGNEEEFTLSIFWQTFSYPRPSNGSFSLEFHNDNELRNVFIQGHESQVQDLLPDSIYNKAWGCGTQNENERCKFLRKGNLAWKGKYTYTLKGNSTMQTTPTPTMTTTIPTRAEKIYVTGGLSPRTYLVEEFNPVLKEWRSMPSMPTARASYAVAVFKNELFVMGGTADTVEKFSPVTQQWSSNITNLNRKLYHHGAAVLDGRLYVLGGYAEHQALDTVEMYVNNQWQTAPSLPKPRVMFAAVELNGKLYAIGGSMSGKSVDVFNGKSWSNVEDMNEYRRYPGVVTLNGKIYVVGGENKYAERPTGLRTVEMFDPAVNKWKYVASMGEGRRSPGVVSQGGKLFVFGGDKMGPLANTIVLTSAEEYDPVTNKWTDLPDMKQCGGPVRAGVLLV